MSEIDTYYALIEFLKEKGFTRENYPTGTGKYLRALSEMIDKDGHCFDLEYWKDTLMNKVMELNSLGCISESLEVLSVTESHCYSDGTEQSEIGYIICKVFDVLACKYAIIAKPYENQDCPFQIQIEYRDTLDWYEDGYKSNGWKAMDIPEFLEKLDLIPQNDPEDCYHTYDIQELKDILVEYKRKS